MKVTDCAECRYLYVRKIRPNLAEYFCTFAKFNHPAKDMRVGRIIRIGRIKKCKKENMEEKVIAYKGFNKDLTCRGFQYEVGKEYTEEEVSICNRGFHACENPFDVLNFYGDVLNNRFCEVEQSGQIIKDNNKQASSKIKVVAEIGFAGLFKAGVEWIKEITNPMPVIEEIRGGNDKNKIGSSGNSAQIGSSGYSARIGSSGDSARIGSSGDSAQIGSSGNSARIGSSGDSARIGSSGYSAQIGSSGNSAQIGSSGYSARIGSSGDSARIGSSGDSAQIGSSGNSARIGSSGDYARIGSSGYSAQIGSSGDSAQIGSSGNYAQIDSAGEDSVICCAGSNSVVRAKKGSWITLSEWRFSEEKKRDVPICVKTEYVDGEKIKEDTWYKLDNGNFVEVL